MSWGRIVLLNGAGSAGKTSIAKALQSITDEPFLHVQMDVFLEMLPEELQNHSDGITFENVQSGGAHSVAVGVGAVGERALLGMRHSVATMAAQGNNLIVDDVLLGGAWRTYETVLSGFAVSKVGVFAPLEVLEDRERVRRDRIIGLARWQHERVHKGLTYDLEVDTSADSAATCARRIREAFSL